MPSPCKKFTKTYAKNLEGVQNILHIASKACVADRGSPIKALGVVEKFLFTDEQKKEYDAAVANWSKSARKNHMKGLGNCFFVPQDGGFQNSLIGYAKAAEKAKFLVELDKNNCKEVKGALDAFYEFGRKNLGPGDNVDELNRLLDSADAAIKLQSATSVESISSVESRNVGPDLYSKPLARKLLSELEFAADSDDVSNDVWDSRRQGEEKSAEPVPVGPVVIHVTNAATRIIVPEEVSKNFIKVCNPGFGMQISLPMTSRYEWGGMQHIGNYCQTLPDGSGVMWPMPVSHSGSLLLEGSCPVNHDAVKLTESPAGTGDVARKEDKDKASSKRSAQATESRSMIQNIVHIITWPLRAVWGLLMVIFSPIIGLFSSSKSSCGSEVGCCDCHSPVPANYFSLRSPGAGNVPYKAGSGSNSLEERLSASP